MPPRDWRIRIEDILGAIDLIREYTLDMDRVAFGADRRTVDAVVRNLAVHEYFGVDDDVLWDTVTRNLPELQSRLRELAEG